MLLEIKDSKIKYYNKDPRYAYLFKKAYNMDNLKVKNLSKDCK